MKIVRGLLAKSRRIGEHGILEFSLRHIHGFPYIHAGIDCIGFAEIQGQEILMNKGEFLVKIKQILVLGSVAHNDGRELLRSDGAVFVVNRVNRIVPRKRKLPLSDVILFGNIMNIIGEKKRFEVLSETLPYGDVTIRKELGGTAGFQLSAARHHVRLKFHNLIALVGIDFFKLLDILLRQVLRNLTVTGIRGGIKCLLRDSARL